MKSFDKLIKLVFIVMLFSPFISYYTFGVFRKENSTFYFQIIFNLFAIIYIITNFDTLKIEKYLIPFILYLLYIIIWNFYNGNFEKKGFFNASIRDPLATVFILLLISNLNFNEDFIKKSIKIFKTTIIISALVIFVQLINNNFLNPSEIYKLDLRDMQTVYTQRRYSIFGFIDLNEIGFSFIPIVALCISYLQRNKESLWVYLMLAGFTAIFTNTRYIMISYIIITFIIIVQNQNKLTATVKFSLMLFGGAIFFMVILSILNFDVTNWFYERLFSEGSIKNTTRYAALENFLIFFPNAVLFGTGVHLTVEIELASRFSGSSQIHVGYLAHLISYGIIGSIFLFTGWLLFLKKLYLNAKHTRFWGAFFAFSIFLFANTTLVSYSFYSYGLIFAFVFDKYFVDQAKLNPQNN